VYTKQIQQYDTRRTNETNQHVNAFNEYNQTIHATKI